MQHQFNVIKDCCELTLTHDLTQEGPTILAGKYYRMDALTLSTNSKGWALRKGIKAGLSIIGRLVILVPTICARLT